MVHSTDVSAQNKGAWSAEEDANLSKLVARHGVSSWTAIAERMPNGGRTAKSCRLRWYNQLHPSVRATPFSEWEQAVIVRAQEMQPNKWAAMAQLLPGRTDNRIKNHWNATLARKLGLVEAPGPGAHSATAWSADAIAAGIPKLGNRLLDMGASLEWLLEHYTLDTNSNGARRHVSLAVFNEAVQKRTNRPQRNSNSARGRPAAAQADSWQQQEHEQQQPLRRQPQQQPKQLPPQQEVNWDQEEWQTQQQPVERMAEQGTRSLQQLPQKLQPAVPAQQPWQALAEDLQLLATPGRNAYQQQGHAVPLHDSASSTSSSRSSNGMLQVAAQQPAMALTNELLALRSHSMPQTPQPITPHTQQQPLQQARSLPMSFVAAATPAAAAAPEPLGSAPASTNAATAPAALWQKLSKLAAGLASGKLCPRHEAACRRCHTDVCNKLMQGQQHKQQHGMGGASHMDVCGGAVEDSSVQAVDAARHGIVDSASVGHLQQLLFDPSQQQQQQQQQQGQHVGAPSTQLSPGIGSTATMDAQQVHGNPDTAAAAGPGSHAAAHAALLSLQADTNQPLERASSGMSACRPTPLQLELLQLPQQLPSMLPVHESGPGVAGGYADDAGNADDTDAAMDDDDGQPLSEAAYEALMDMMLDTSAAAGAAAGAASGDTGHAPGLRSNAPWPQGACAHMVQPYGTDSMPMHTPYAPLAVPVAIAGQSQQHHHQQQLGMPPGLPNGLLHGAFAGSFASSCSMQFGAQQEGSWPLQLTAGHGITLSAAAAQAAHFAALQQQPPSQGPRQLQHHEQQYLDHHQHQQQHASVKQQAYDQEREQPLDMQLMTDALWLDDLMSPAAMEDLLATHDSDSVANDAVLLGVC